MFGCIGESETESSQGNMEEFEISGRYKSMHILTKIFFPPHNNLLRVMFQHNWSLHDVFLVYWTNVNTCILKHNKNQVLMFIYPITQCKALKF